MPRSLLTSLAFAAVVAALSYRAAAPSSPPAPEQREATFADDSPEREAWRKVDDDGCVVICRADVETEFGRCERHCEVTR